MLLQPNNVLAKPRDTFKHFGGLISSPNRLLVRPPTVYQQSIRHNEVVTAYAEVCPNMQRSNQASLQQKTPRTAAGSFLFGIKVSRLRDIWIRANRRFNSDRGVLSELRGLIDTKLGRYIFQHSFGVVVWR